MIHMKNRLFVFFIALLILLPLMDSLFGQREDSFETDLTQQQAKIPALKQSQQPVNTPQVEVDVSDKSKTLTQLNQIDEKNDKSCTSSEDWWLNIFNGNTAIASWLVDHGYKEDRFPVYGNAVQIDPAYRYYDENIISQLAEIGDNLAAATLADQAHIKAFRDDQGPYDLRSMNLVLVDKAIEYYKSGLIRGNFANISRLSSIYREKYLYSFYVDPDSKQWNTNPKKEQTGDINLLVESLAWLKFGFMLNDPVVTKHLLLNKNSFKRLNLDEVLLTDVYAQNLYQRLQNERVQLGFARFEYELAPPLRPIVNACIIR